MLSASISWCALVAIAQVDGRDCADFASRSFLTAELERKVERCFDRFGRRSHGRSRAIVLSVEVSLSRLNDDAIIGPPRVNQTELTAFLRLSIDFETLFDLGRRSTERLPRAEAVRRRRCLELAHDWDVERGGRRLQARSSLERGRALACVWADERRALWTS